MAKTTEFFVDTNILITHIRQPNQSIIEQSSLRYGMMVVSDVVVFELEVGARRAGRSFEFATHFSLVKTYPILLDIWLLTAKIQADLIKQNLVIGLTDTLIASTAIYHNLPLLTLNQKHFQRIPSLQLITVP